MLDNAKQPKQTDVSQRFGSMDRIQMCHVMKAIKICREYHLPLVLTFVDYEKAFDSIETNSIQSALVDQEEDLGEELKRRIRAVLVALAPVMEAMHQEFRAPLFDSTVLPALLRGEGEE
ncbi:hypothetical protein RB195_009131 [Necator americanus]|uniref:Reverse transcriptase domain-containing protein n=1 Tax=Necator americanus TaxID=51031 RepID=A0ABR1CRV7_NECAM